MQPTEDQLEKRVRDAMQADDWGTVERLRPKIDTAEQARQEKQPSMHGAALWYAEQRIPVFPLQPGGKRPYRGSHGLNEATTDTDMINRWWGHRPDANIGLATGHRFDVIDIDGPDGIRSYLDHWREFDLPLVGIQSTPRPGGIHLLVAPTGGSNTAAMYPGIDYRGLGGYIVAAPSTVDRRKDAMIKHDGQYHWLAPIGDTPTCRLHLQNHQPDACWTCQQITTNQVPS